MATTAATLTAPPEMRLTPIAIDSGIPSSLLIGAAAGYFAPVTSPQNPAASQVGTIETPP